MPDNVDITAGSGTTVATDLIGSAHYQRVKIGLGADGTAVDAVAGAGVVTTGTQRVTLASDDPAVTSLSTISTSLQNTLGVTGTVYLGGGVATIGKLGSNSGVTIGAVELAAAQTLATVTTVSTVTAVTTVGTVSTVTNLSQMGGAAIAMGTGVRSAGTQRVTIATDDIVPVSQSGTWTVGLSAAQTLATVTTVSTVTAVTTVGTVSTVTNLSQLGGTAIAMNTGVRAAGVQRVTICTDDTVTTTLGSETVSVNAVKVGGTAITVNNGAPTNGTQRVTLADISVGDYEAVAAGQTTVSLGATGGTGDYLGGILVIPATTSPGSVLLRDGSGSDMTVFTGGASSVSNLVPFFIPLGIVSGSGAWKVTTGSNVSVIGVGNFT